MAGYCFVIFLSVLAVGLSDEYWCCKTKSKHTDRCDKCRGAQCKQMEIICPEVGKYRFQTQCGHNTTCKESEHPEEYWYCNEDKKCAKCKGEHGEFKMADGGCPKGELHPDESLCKKSKACSNSSHITAAPPMTYWYCNKEQQCASCKGEPGVIKLSDGGCPKVVLYASESKCVANATCSDSTTSTTEMAAFYWYCNEDDNECSFCQGQCGKIPESSGGCPISKQLYSSLSECNAETKCIPSSDAYDYYPTPSLDTSSEHTPDSDSSTGPPLGISSEPTTDYPADDVPQDSDSQPRAEPAIVPPDYGPAPEQHQDYWFCLKNGNGTCVKKPVGKGVTISLLNMGKEGCEGSKLCQSSSGSNPPTCRDVCETYCEGETKDKYYLSFEDNKCHQCKELDCCNGATVYQRQEECEKCITKG